MKKIVFAVVIVFACFGVFAVPPRPADRPFAWPTELNYPFLPKRKMIFVNGVVKNKDATALPDIDAQYSDTVKVDDLLFKLPGEICEATSACYKADLNNDGIPDYLFVSVKVTNGRFAGESNVAVYVSNREKRYERNVMEVRFLEAEREKGRILLVKYAYSDDDVTLLREFYRFEPDGRLRLHDVAPFRFKY